jgi:hypothetical protein
MGSGMTTAEARVMRAVGTEVAGGADQAHEGGTLRPQYRVHPQVDGGLWRGPTEAAWTTRVLRGARPPRQPAARPGDASVPHG